MDFLRLPFWTLQRNLSSRKMTQTVRVLSMVLMSAVFFGACLAKPTELLLKPEALNPVLQQANVVPESGVKRNQRSPQFGLIGAELEQIAELEGDRNQYNRRPQGPDGCFDCAGGLPGYYPQEPLGGIGGSFSAANAESGSSGGFGGGSQAEADSVNFNLGGNGGFYGPNRGDGSVASANAGANAGSFGGAGQANAESASFNFGPLSASFSHSEASSRNRKF